METEILEFACVRHYFEDSINLGFNHFISVLEVSKFCEQDIKIEWKSLIEQHINKKITAKKAIEKIDKWFLDLVADNKIEDWNHLGVLLGSNTLADLFFKIYKQVDDKTYWKLLGYCYTNSYLGFDEKFLLKLLFTSKKPFREFLMNKEDKNLFDTFPEELTIYRGCSLSEIESKDYRFSWTLSKDVANFFAFEYHRNKNTECGVVELTVKKEKLLAYFNGRQEEEIIFLS
jgi:hypothetical protein